MYLRSKRTKRDSIRENHNFLCLMETFCCSNNSELSKLYSKLRFDKIEFNCSFYAYFLFLMFLKVFNGLNLADRLKQITRTTLCLKNMPLLFQLKCRP